METLLKRAAKYFCNSSRRCEELKTAQAICDTKGLRVMKVYKVSRQFFWRQYYKVNRKSTTSGLLIPLLAEY